MKDIVGREIVVGSRVAYPGRAGSSLWMNVALVTGFGEKTVYSYASGGARVPTLLVNVLRSSDGYRRGMKSAIYVLDRVVVIDSPSGEGK